MEGVGGAQPETPSPPRRSKWIDAARRWGRACAAISFALILGTELAGRHWPIACAAPYLPQLAFLGFAGLALLLVVQRRASERRGIDRVLLILGLFAGAYGFAVARDLVPARTVAAAPVAPNAFGRTVTIVYANVHTSNTDHARLLELIRRADPDIVFLVELNSSWLRALKPLDDAYPHRRVVPDDAGNFGMGFWSRLDVQRAEFVLLKPEAPGTLYDVPQLEATVLVPSGDTRRELHLLGLHPLPPLSPGNLAARDAVLRGARASADARPGASSIILGDLNATRYCRILQEVAADRFRDATASYRYSWPDTWSWWAVGIKLDYLLVDDSCAVQSVNMDDSIGSDHRPIVARLAIRE